MAITLKDRLGTTCFAFRGYNVTNLGRSVELLEHRAYGPTVKRYLSEAGKIASEATGERVDLFERLPRKELERLRATLR